MAIITSISILAGIFTLRNPKTLPFRQIRIIAGSDHIKITELKNIAIYHIQGSFFSFNALKLQTALMSLPWVHDVSVRRVWPNKLGINVKEQCPIARWNQGQLVTQEGTLSYIPVTATIPKNIPQLNGPSDSEETVLNQFQKFSQLLIPFHVEITTLCLTKSGTWFLTLNSHVKVYLGQDNIEQRFKKFIRLYSQIIGVNINRVEYIDLRYSHGFAIRWRN